MASTPDTMPYEIKRLIYDHLDLETIKILRYVSKSWASVGIELLFQPSFYFNYRSVDLRRLLDISACPSVSNQAAKTIKKIVFQNDAWDPSYFRRIVCQRHQSLETYDNVHFVLDEAEVTALEELSEVSERVRESIEDPFGGDILVKALNAVPHVDAIEIHTRNPFQHPILRRVWEEYAIDAYVPEQYNQDLMHSVLSTAKKAGLTIQHFSHDQLLACRFEEYPGTWKCWEPFDEYVSGLKSLELIISDHTEVFDQDEKATLRLRALLESTEALEHLSLAFHTLQSPSDFFPTVSTGALRSLRLSSFTIEPVNFLALLRCNSVTLKRLHLCHVNIREGFGSLQALLESLKDMLQETLEQFQLSGMVRSVDGIGEQWILRPYYDQQWNMKEGAEQSGLKAKQLEDFVLRGEPWPMAATDRLDIVLA